MPISQSDLLLKLIKSMTKAEKRNFKLYSKRLHNEGDARILQLFDILDKQRQYSEDEVLEKLSLQKNQYINLKRLLYEHLLTSLRLVHIRKDMEIEARELLDYASILYGKGLYIQALKILQRAKSFTEKNKLDYLLLEIIEFEKKIESRHITRSSTERMDELTAEASMINRRVTNIVALSNLKLKLQRLFINQGYIRDKQDQKQIEQLFQEYLPHGAHFNFSFFEKIYLFQSYFWYHYIQLQFERCHHFAQDWVNLFQENPPMIEKDVDMYMKGLHHLLTTSFYLKDYPTFTHTLDTLERFRKESYPSFNMNSKILSFLYVHQGRLNKSFIEGTFSEGIQQHVPRTLKRIQGYKNKLDPHKIMILYYKIAWMYFADGQPGKAIDYLNKIINDPARHLRDDIQIYARLLFLMAHYDLKNYDLLEYLIAGTQRMFEKVQEQGTYHSDVLQFMKKIASSNPDDSMSLFRQFLQRLKELEKNPFEKRAFVYLDMISWIESKLAGKSVKAIASDKFTSIETATHPFS
ncbi:MAG: hypothetical protein NWS63_09560 [Saprospiraceae bacterium]|jgi:hypothetical protein|nr:hypothetical protein [Saprospiraceae bacterium]MDP4998500.1 hypothetical protein [Saprospiraceae bacterium]